jgi:uncharacterized protein (TIGR00297 family)
VHIALSSAAAPFAVPALRHPVRIAALLTILFAVLARLLRGVTTWGALAGAVICLLLYLGGGPGAFAALVTVFCLTWMATRIGYRRKQSLGTAEKREGRKASQVLANLSVAAGFALLHIFRSEDAFLVASAAALAEAAADTISSELGQASSASARLITTWEPVVAGTDGAITLTGTLAGLLAAVAISLVSVASGFLPRRWLAVVIGAAMAGTFADSAMGASWERHHWLNNDSVNFLSTLVAAAIAYVICVI